MTKYDILNCPFCGGPAQVSNDASKSVIHCSCGARSKESRLSGVHTTVRIQELVELWNTRVIPSPGFPFTTYTYKEWGEK